MQQEFDPRDLDPDDLDPAQTIARIKKWRRVAMMVALVVVCGFGGLLYYAYQYRQQILQREGVGPVVIRAGANPVRVKPADPGGLDVPNRDLLLLNPPTATQDPPAAEHLLPAPETPLPKPAAPLAPSLPPAPVPAPTPAPPPAPPTPPAPTPKPAAKLPAKPAAKLAAGAQNLRVQLAAVLGESRIAAGEWEKIKAQYPEVAPYSMVLQKIESNGRTYHRIQLTGFADQTAAAKLCRTLKGRGQPCLVVGQP